MKYLKLYESLSNQFYHEIEFDEFYNSVWKNKHRYHVSWEKGGVYIPIRYKKLLMTLSYDINDPLDVVINPKFNKAISNGSYDIPSTIYMAHNFISITPKVSKNSKENTNYVIKYTADEYWYVDVDNSMGYLKGPEHSYYRCDQWEGLVEFFKDRKLFMK